MNIVIFQAEENFNESLGDFRNLLFASNMKYLASDLLDDGLSPSTIKLAIDNAISICHTADIEIRQHFIPVYTQLDNMTINDCKLSSLGIGLVLLNAGVNNPRTAQWQLKVLRNYLNN